MRLRSTIPCLIVLAVAIAMIPTVSAASYTLSINPSTTVSLGTPMTFILSLSGGFKNTAYTILFAVVKPNGNGSATDGFRCLLEDVSGLIFGPVGSMDHCCSSQGQSRKLRR